MIKLKIKLNNIYDLLNDVKENIYKRLDFKKNILKKYNNDKNKYYFLIQNNYKYELINPYIVNNNVLYKITYDFFEYNDNKYNLIKITKDNKKFISITKYEPVDKLFSSYYEIIHKYNNIINSNILEITN
jgi:hypothetical protein